MLARMREQLVLDTGSILVKMLRLPVPSL